MKITTSYPVANFGGVTSHSSLSDITTAHRVATLIHSRTMAAMLKIPIRVPQAFPRSLRFPCARFCRASSSATAGYTPGGENDPDAYRRATSAKIDNLKKRLEDPMRFKNINDRDESSIVPAAVTEAMVTGKYLCVYRGIDMLKGPEDMAILYQMLWHVKPRTVIELGSYTGASALWIADSLNGANIECSVFSTDIDLSLLHSDISSFKPPNLSFIEGDCNHIENVFPSEFLKAQPHPFVVIDDAHVNFDKVMDYFHCHLIPGDYIICEDTCPNVPASALDSSEYKEPLGFEKLHSWKKFLNRHHDMYAVDSFYSDLFGYNASSNWNGYVRRMK